MSRSVKKFFNYSECAPDLTLPEFIKCFWNFANASEKEQQFTILPDGCFDLIIQLNGKKLKEVSLSGIWSNPVDVKIPDGTVLIGIRFKLLAAEYIFDSSLSSFLNGEMIIEEGFWSISKMPLVHFKATVLNLS